MKIISTICVLLLLCVLLPSSSFATIWAIRTNHSLVKTYTDASANVYRIYAQPSITVITPKEFSFHFFPAWEILQNLASSYACKAWLNGSYFGYNDDWTYFPAWIWYQFGSFLKPPYIPAIDRNLRVLLSWNRNSIDLIENDQFDFSTIHTGNRSWYVNAWPRLVRDWRINPDIVLQKSHRQRETTRVWFIRNPSGEIHFIIATQAISLPQFIAFSYSVWLWTWSFQFVNLDWWSSTSMITPYNSYQSRKRLPIFICIH